MLAQYCAKFGTGLYAMLILRNVKISFFQKFPCVFIAAAVVADLLVFPDYIQYIIHAHFDYSSFAFNYSCHKCSFL